MSTNLNYKQVANVSRRTWDVETYEKRAQARQEAMEKGESATDDDAPTTTTAGIKGDDEDKQEFRPALKGAAGPEGSDRAFLQARSTGVMQDLESQVGQTTFVDTSGGGDAKKASDGVVTATGVGWHCKVCDCFLKDSHTYLDHINGRKHQRKLGYSMRVQRSTTDDLKDKLQALKQKKASAPAEDEEEIDFAARVEQKDQALRERQEERRRRRKERKQKAKQQQHEGEQDEEEESAPQPTDASAETKGTDNNEGEGEEEEEEDPQVDSAMAAMMGFSGFGGSAKN